MLAQALSDARRLIAKNEEVEIARILKKGEFPDKNDALISAYGKFMSLLTEKGLTDSISVIRKAISESKPISAEFLILKEFPLAPVEKALLDHVSSGVYKELELPGLFGRQKRDIKIDGFTEAYGTINEAEGIISRIYRESMPLDKCLIACTNTNRYGQVFYDITRRYGIPATFGSGISVNNSNPAALLRLLYDWNTSGFNGTEALRKVIFSPVFDRARLADELGVELSQKTLEDVAGMAGSLRISFDQQTNRSRIAEMKKVKLESEEARILPLVEKLAEEIETGYAGIIEKYCVLRHETEERIDLSGLSVICSALKAYSEHSGGLPAEEIIPELLNKTVSSESSRPGMLHICSVQAAFSSIRDNLFVCGLSADDFPGTPSENHLLLDSDLELFGVSGAPTSQNRIAARKESLDSLLSAASSLGVSVRLSYSDYDLASIKDQNRSSALYELMRNSSVASENTGAAESTEKVGFFESGLSASEPVGREIASDREIEPQESAPVLTEAKNKLERYWAPTQLELFFECPRHFYLRYIAGIREEEQEDPFTVMTAAEQGTLVHKLMEDVSNASVSRQEFLEMSSKAFDDRMVRRPPVHEADAISLKKEFLEIMANAYDSDPKNRVIKAEGEFEAEHPSGVRVKGFPDRVEETGSGEFIIAEYKTKRRTDHIPNDIETCFQVVVYAWLCRQAGIDITRAEYRYVRLNKTIECAIDDTILKRLGEKLTGFRDAMQSNDFPGNPGQGSENCRYCTFRDICEWDRVPAEEEEDE